MTPFEVATKIRILFESLNYTKHAPRNIINFEGTTELVVAGVQMFDDVIHHNASPRTGEIFVAQPSVRMQFQQSVASQEGTSTSFVNICTEKMCADFGEHLTAVDAWCSVLSRLGLHMNDVVVIMRTSANDWGTGSFSALELFFSYGGLELGDAAYMLVPQRDRRAIPISDIGFGLERIAWAVNKTESYYDLLTPWSVEGSREMLDSCRTLALLGLCGVQPASKGAGLQFKRFTKVLTEKHYGKDIYYALSYYFDYWAQFIKPSVSKEAVLRLVRIEIERVINLRISVSLKRPPPKDSETTEEYFNRLVYTYGVNIQQLRDAINICKQ